MTKEQWLAIKNCDKSCDGEFYYGLTSTKKVCRPSCPKPSYDPKRIVVFGTLREALDAGYQPCSRCRPDVPDWSGAKNELSRSAAKLIREHSTEKFSLPALAETLHVDPSYLARTFKSVVGCTLLTFHNTVRCEAAQELLAHSGLSVSYIASAVGYASASHFAQTFRKIVGCTPSEYRDRYFASLEE